jgi:hypothetical protein
MGISGLQLRHHGSLGIDVLELKNKFLLCKWLFKLLNEEGVWQEMLHNKYLHTKSLSKITSKPTDSSFWKGFMEVKKISFRGPFTVVDGTTNRS